MAWFGKLTLGSLGMLLGGPLGAVIGGALGHHLIDRQETGAGTRPGIGAREQQQAAYFVCVFSILGKLAKADGVVSEAELRVVNDFIASMPVPEPEKQFARQVGTEAKDSPYAIDDFARQFYQICGSQPEVPVSFLDVLMRVAAADGQLHPAEERLLERVRTIFQISDRQFAAIKANYFSNLDKMYARLDCTPQSSNQEIKAAYRKLIKDFHPDTIVSKGLPEEFIDFATTRFREIQEAYEAVAKERGM